MILTKSGIEKLLRAILVVFVLFNAVSPSFDASAQKMDGGTNHGLEAKHIQESVSFSEKSILPVQTNGDVWISLGSWVVGCNTVQDFSPIITTQFKFKVVSGGGSDGTISYYGYGSTGSAWLVNSTWQEVKSSMQTPALNLNEWRETEKFPPSIVGKQRFSVGCNDGETVQVDVYYLQINPVLYLSDTPWVSAVSGNGGVQLDKSSGNWGVGPTTITLDGQTYAKGLGVHAYSEIVYNLQGINYGLFVSDVGVDDETGNGGSVIFSVYVNNVEKFNSGIMTGSSPTKDVVVDLSGATQLKLVVTDAGDNINWDHADWANARLINDLAADTTNSTVEVSPVQVGANGIDSATVTVTVKNANGYPISGQPVEIAMETGPGLNINNTVAALNEYIAIDNTDVNGVAEATLTATTPGVRTIVAKSGQIQLTDQATVTFTPVSCVPTPSGLIGWWTGDGTWNDVLGGHHGTPQGQIGFADGIKGQAFNFDGVDDYIELGGWFTYQDFAVAMWVKPGDTQNVYADIIDNNHSTNTNWVLQQYGGTTNQYGWGQNFNLTPNEWHYLVITHDNGGNYRAYVNGGLVGDGNFGPVNYANTPNLLLGRWSGGNGRNWRGVMDEVEIYDRALTGTEIANLFQAGALGKCYEEDTSINLTAPSQIVPGTAIDYGITVRRTGDTPAENTILEITLPADVTYVSQSSMIEPTVNGQTLTWSLGTITGGDAITFAVVGQVSNSVPANSILETQANVSSASPDVYAGNNTIAAQSAIVNGYAFTFEFDEDGSSHVASIGSSTEYGLVVKNTGIMQDTYTLSVGGDISSSNYELTSTNITLLPGETATVPLNVQFLACNSQTTTDFNVSVASLGGQHTETRNGSITLTTAPQVSGMTPLSGQTLGGQNPTIQWQTDIPTTAVLTVYPIGAPQETTVINSPEGTFHSVVIPNRDWDTTYEWTVDITSVNCNSTVTMPVRQFAIAKGLEFTAGANRILSFTVDRDYDQRVDVNTGQPIKIKIRNNDTESSHTLKASVINPYGDEDDILINFVDSGSIDLPLEVGPESEVEVAIAIHAQDAKEGVYEFTATLESDWENGTSVRDNIKLHVVVLSDGNYIIEEVSFDEVTLARTYRITNSVYGRTITDLSLEAVIPGTNAPAKVFVQPNLDHVRLEPGQSILITVYPVFTAEDAAQSTAGLQQNSSQNSSNGNFNISLNTVQPSVVAPIDYELKASGSGVQKSATGSVSCGVGKSIIPVIMQNCTMTFETQDWYCTNRPTINTPIIIPAFINPASITSASLGIVYAPQSNVQPHNGIVSFNGYQVGSYSNQIPTGQFSFNIPASNFQGSIAGNALQNVQMNTTHPNPGHYVSATGYQLNIGISQATTYVCADSQSSAALIVQSQYACSATYAFNWLTDLFPGSVYNGGLDRTSIGAKVGGIVEEDGKVSISSCLVKQCADPINTKTGTSSFTVSDLSFPTTAGDLIFQRSYSSITADVYTDVLGPGWSHNHDARLIFADDPGGMEGFVLFKSVLGNQYLYKDEGNGTYTPGPGVLAELTKTVSTYVITSTEQEKFIFDLDGRLLSREDANGNAFDYDYDGQGRLFKVNADNGTRFIQFGYDGQGRIVAVSDHASREVEFGYDANGDLTTYTDLLGQVWTYSYDSEHRQTEVLDPTGKETVRTEYDLQGRAYRQFDGEGNLLVMVVYNSDGSTTIYDGLNRAEEHQYNEHGIATETTNEVAQTETTVFDENFRPTSVSNDAGHTLQMTWSEDGQDLLSKTDPAGNTITYTYDAMGNLLTTTDPLSNITTYTYEGDLLTSTTDASGNITTYTYTSEGYLESTTDWMSRTTSYTYDTHGQRISMTDPNNHTWQYEYDSLGRLTLTTDPRGRKTYNEYDAAGQLIRTVQNYDPNRLQNDQNLYNIQTVYAYDPRGNQVSVIDTFGRETQYEYDDANRLIKTTDPLGNETTNAYDAAGQLVSTTDARGNKTTYQYDPSGRLMKTLNPLGVSTGTTTFNSTANTSTVTDVGGNSWTYYYDEMGRVERVVDPLGNSTYTTYDPNGNVNTRTDPLGRITSYDYDALNRLVSTTAANNGVTETVYNEDGQRIATIDPLDNQTTYIYDAQSRLIATTDPLNRSTQTEYDSYGRRIASIDAMGNRTEYTYDLMDRVVSVDDALGNITTTIYDALGNVISRTDANGNATTYTYDALNRVWTVTDPNGRVTTNSYDAVGNLVSVTNDLNETTTYGYDALNRQVSVTDPLGNITQTTFNTLGQVSSTIAPDGTVTYYQYDALGRHVAVLLNYKPAEQPDAETNVRYEYTYNAVGNRVTVKDPNGNITSYGYDVLNRVTSMTDPLNRTTSYTYDLAGRQLSKTDANGKTTYFTYDAAGQLTLIDYPEPDADVAFSYDLNGQRIGMTDGLGTTTWTYDPLNRPLSVLDPNNATVGYGYDPVGNRTQLTYPNSNVVNYTYDEANQLIGVTDWDNQATTYEYDDAGRLISILRPNGVASAYGYDSAGRVTNVNHASGANSLASYAYTYDPAGNIAQVIENLNQPVSTPTPTHTPSETPTATTTNTPTETPTLTPTITDTPTLTPTNTLTLTPTSTSTSEPSTVYTLVLQPDGANGVDTYLLRSSATSNYGNSADMGVGENNNATNKIARSLIKFDLSSLPADANIISASLSLWTSSDFSSDDDTIGVYRLKVPFSETQATWNRSATGINWQGVGASGADDRETVAIGNAQILNNEPLNAEKQIALDPAKIQEMFNGTFVNNGFLIKTEGELNDRFDFKTSDTTNAPQRPKLVIQFTANSITPTPSATPTNTPVPGFIFDDDFESGNFSAWEWANTDGGDLSVTAQAAAVGNYGMQAELDDGNELIVFDESPNEEDHFSARFYFHPNSVQAPEGGFYLMSISSQANWGLACLWLDQQGEYYSLGLCGHDDAEDWHESEGAFIANEWQAVELEWKAATSPGANDGYIRLFVGDQLADSIENLDNDTLAVSEVTFGIDGTGVLGTGTMYFDAYESRTGDHIGLHPNGPAVNPPPARPDALFADNFESGNLSRWNLTRTSVDGGDLSVSAAAAYQSNAGLQVLIDDTIILRAIDSSPASETHYRARFYFDPNSITMSPGSVHNIFEGYNNDTQDLIFRLAFLYENGSYKLRPHVFNDNWSYITGNKYTISNDWHVVEIEWQAASAPGTNDGLFTLWIDDVLMGSISNVDNDGSQHRLDEVRLGATAGVDSTTSGSYYFDNFESRRQTYIGPLAPPATATPTETVSPTLTITPEATSTPTETLTPSPTPLANLPGGVYSNVSFTLPDFLQIRSDYSPDLQANNVTTTINYTYDALHRITSASYSDGRSFSYTYDANGNALTYTDPTSTTDYTYDTANQLLTAEKGESLWYYVYDANGSLVEVLPNNTEASGAKRYTYNTAGYLTQVEAHNGTGWDVQAEMDYNGLGQRLGMDASGVIAYYVMDGNRPLTATTGTDTTSYLYGLGAIGEETDAWSYGLTDGTNTQRQLTDATGEVTYSARYTPWGDTLEASGTGNLTFGYFGGLMDAATGLLYVGDGQYYDPTTGRFLTRNARPNQGNPYLPFDPTGAMLGPLGVLALVLGSKKKKSKYDVLLFVLVFAVASGMTLTACTLTAEEIGITPTGTPMPVSATVTQTQGIVTAVISTPTQLVTVTAPAPSSTPIYNCPAHIYDYDENEDIKQRIKDEFGIILGGSFYGTQEWPSVHIQIIYGALSRINDALGSNLKSRLGVEAVFHKKKSLDGKYSGYARSTGSIEFYLVDDFPYHLIYHEMGHLLNNTQGQRYTNSLETTVVYTNYPDTTGERVMGGTPYNRIDGQGLISLTLQDPCTETVAAELHPRWDGGNDAGEEWGDLFANYVADNFNSLPEGRAKYNWVHDQLFGG